MIDKFGLYDLICDVCGNSADEQFSDFSKAVDYKKANGWKSQKAKSGWQDVCPDCQDRCRKELARHA